jgi:hypothetical protein
MKIAAVEGGATIKDEPVMVIGGGTENHYVRAGRRLQGR